MLNDTIVGDFNYQNTNGQIDSPQESSITTLKQFPEFGNSEAIMGPPDACFNLTVGFLKLISTTEKSDAITPTPTFSDLDDSAHIQLYLPCNQ